MEPKSSKYLVVKQTIQEQIETGKLRLNDKLPTEAEYAEIFQVSSITIRRALAELADEGYVKRLKHKGTFVTSPANENPASCLIALILCAGEDQKDNVYVKIMKGVQTVASRYNYSLLVEWCDADAGHEREVIQKMLDKNVEGFIIYSYDPEKSLENYRWLNGKKIPFVLMDRYDVHYPCYFSGCNNYDGAALMTEYLLEMKHRKIRFAGFHYFLKSEQERFDGFCGMMQKAGYEIPPDILILNADYDVLAGQIRNHEITAVFCCNDKLALKMIRNLRKRGICIPQDVSIAGFDDWRDDAGVEEELTTVRQNFLEIGENAAYLLLSVIKGRLQGSPVKILSDVELVKRSSVCVNPYQEKSI